MEKFDGKCAYCGSEENLTIDHIIPWSRGGKNSFDNFVLSCDKCNTRKGSSIDWTDERGTA